jgi:hypothetical protein
MSKTTADINICIYDNFKKTQLAAIALALKNTGQ